MVCKHCEAVVQSRDKLCPNCGREMGKIPTVLDQKTVVKYDLFIRHKIDLTGLGFGIVIVAALLIPELAEPIDMGYGGLIGSQYNEVFVRIFFFFFRVYVYISGYRFFTSSADN